MPPQAHGSNDYTTRDLTVEADTDAQALRIAAELIERDEFADFDIENIRFDQPTSVDRVLLVVQLRRLTSEPIEHYDVGIDPQPEDPQDWTEPA